MRPPLPAAALTVAGRVDASGVCGERVTGERDWTLRLSLAEWCERGRRPVRETLRLRQRCTREQLLAMQARIAPGRVILARVRLDAGATLQGVLVEVLDADAPVHVLAVVAPRR